MFLINFRGEYYNEREKLLIKKLQQFRISFPTSKVKILINIESVKTRLYSCIISMRFDITRRKKQLINRYGWWYEIKLK